MYILIFITFIHLSTYAATFCESALTIDSYLKGQGEISLGEPVRIRQISGDETKAYFLGIVEDRAYFTTVESMGYRRPVFYIPMSEAKFEHSINQRNGNQLLLSQKPPKELPLIRVDGELCGPQTVHSCLTHLDRIGLVPEQTSKLLNAEGNPLFKNMVLSFSRNAMSVRPKSIRLNKEYLSAVSSPERKRLLEEVRAESFNLILQQLKDIGVQAELTTSYGKLVKHLRAGLPVYISVSATPLPTFRPSFKEKDSEWNLGQISGGAFPVPIGAPAFQGFHAVYAFAALPRAKGLRGILEGSRIVVLDPSSGQINIWPTISLWLTQNAKFILIGTR
jgi:hypothetical protein